jgi:predicted TIM-barrel fold metal-dependent hydrolase
MAEDRQVTNSTREAVMPLGLPDAERLKKYRIWDCYFTPAHAHPGRDGRERLIAEIQRSIPAIKLGCFERLCYFAHVGIGTTGDAQLEASLRSNANLIELPLKRYPEMLIAMIQLNGHDVNASLDAIDRWIGDGPMIGVYLPGGGPGAMTCTHPNIDRLVRRVAELRGLIIQHTWFKTGGKQGPGESTPAELAELARRYPEQPFICAHAGGEWERGLRAVRREPNVVVETSGFDATAGFVEMAIREVGAKRIVFGSHLPSRSLGTELAKVTAANVSEADKRLILGENFRRLIRSRTL